MIGAVRFVDDDADVALTAVLEDDGTWTCPRSDAIAQRLNADFSPIGTIEGDSPWGHWSLVAAARRLGGQAFIPVADVIRSALSTPDRAGLGRAS